MQLEFKCAGECIIRHLGKNWEIAGRNIRREFDFFGKLDIHFVSLGEETSKKN